MALHCKFESELHPEPVQLEIAASYRLLPVLMLRYMLENPVLPAADARVRSAWCRSGVPTGFFKVTNPATTSYRPVTADSSLHDWDV